jgi:hypothetical protein
MRTSALLLLACCGPATPPIAAPQVEPDTPVVEDAAAVKPDAGTPAAPSQPPDAPAGEPVLNKLTVPGEPAPNLAIGKAEQAAIDAACKQLCTRGPCECDVTRPMPQYMLLRQFRPNNLGDGYDWYVLQRTDKGWITLMDVEYLHGGEEHVHPHVACGAPGPGPVPEGRGLVGVRLPDLNLDGRPDLLFECRFDWRHDVHYCLSDVQYCTAIGMRFINDGELYLDADLEFRDGWFIPTVRVDIWERLRGNVKVDGVRTPDPAPGR